MTSKIKVDNINKVSDDSNIINKCGTTITILMELEVQVIYRLQMVEIVDGQSGS